MKNLCSQWNWPLSEEERLKIHEASLQLLEKIGVVVEEPEAQRHLVELGADLDVGSSCVTIPPEIVLWALDSTPKKVSLCDRCGRTLPIWGDAYQLGTQGSAIHIYDGETHALRPVFEQDVVDFVRVADALPSLTVVQSNASISANPPSRALLLGIRAVLSNSTKHCLAQPLNVVELDAWAEACQRLLGETSLREKPILSVMTSTTSPLTIDENNAQMMMYAAEKGIPLDVKPAALSGGSAPYPLAGTLAQHNAEVLAALVLSQAVRPHSPFIYGTASTVMDMRSGGCALGAIEGRLMTCAISQLVKSYQLPFEIGWSNPDAFLPDAQCGAEKASTIFAGLLGGVNLWLGAGGFGASAVSSMEQLVIDADLFQNIVRFFAGIEVNERTLSLETVRRVGHGGTYLTDPDIMKWLRSDEHYHPQLFNREGSVGANVDARARAKVAELMAEHRSTVPEGEVETIEEFVRERADSWGLSLE